MPVTILENDFLAIGKHPKVSSTHPRWLAMDPDSQVRSRSMMLKTSFTVGRKRSTMPQTSGVGLFEAFEETKRAKQNEELVQFSLVLFGTLGPSPDDRDLKVPHLK